MTDEPEDTCRPVTLDDGTTVRVHGSGELSDQAREALGALVEAARRKYAAEHPGWQETTFTEPVPNAAGETIVARYEVTRCTASTITDADLDRIHATLDTIRDLAVRAQQITLPAPVATYSVRSFAATILRTLDGTTPQDPA